MANLSTVSDADLLRALMAPQAAAAAAPSEGAPDGRTLATDDPGGKDVPRITVRPGLRSAGIEALSDVDLMRRLTEAPPAPEPTNAPQQAAIDFMNQGPAAAQGTTPNVAAQSPNLLSAQVFETDAGDLHFRDPATGEVVPTDRNKHVVLRDPGDNSLKVFARTPHTDEGRLAGIGRILLTGAATGAPTARPSLPLLGSGPAPSVDALRADASAQYRSPAVKDLAVRASALRERLAASLQGLTNAGFHRELAPKTHAVLADAQNPPPGAFVTGDNLNTLRQTLGRAAGSTDPQERAAAQRAIEAVDQFLTELRPADVLRGDPQAAAEAFNAARGNYAAMARSERVTGKMQSAELAADAANSGMNLDNSIRNRFRSILESPEQRRGFSTAEREEMLRIVKGGPVRNVSRRLGNLLGGGGGLGAVVTAGLGAAGGAAAAGPAGALAGLAPAIGYGLKVLENALTKAQVRKLDEMVRSRSPLATAIESSGAKWSQAAQRVSERPTYQHYVAASLAARNFANTLRSAGIEVSPKVLVQRGGSADQKNGRDDQPEQ